MQTANTHDSDAGLVKYSQSSPENPKRGLTCLNGYKKTFTERYQVKTTKTDNDRIIQESFLLRLKKLIVMRLNPV